MIEIQNTIAKSAIGAEGGALGAMILDPVEIATVRGILTPDDFGRTEHRLICEAIYDLSEDGGAVDSVRIRDWLLSRDQLDTIGGVEYLVRVAETCPSPANAEFYARSVKEHSTRRKMAEVAQRLTRRCLTPEGADAEIIRADAVKDLTDIDATADKGSICLSDALSTLDPGDTTLFASTGFRAIDGVIGGLGRGHNIVIAGRPGMGKSALMTEMSLRLAELEKKKIIFFSLEMSAVDIAMRLVCSRAGIDLQRTIRGHLTQDEQELFYGVRDYMKRLSIRFDCRSLTPARLRAAVLSAKRRGECDVVFLDYMGLVNADARTKSRYEATSDISNSIKRLALDADVPIVVGCQLNRANEARQDKRPTAADLRDSGAIEQDADVVLLLHRPHYYDRTAYPELAEVIVAKNRRGPMPTIELGFTGIYTRFYDPSEQDNR